jgi:hypothetical protein
MKEQGLTVKLQVSDFSLDKGTMNLVVLVL